MLAPGIFYRHKNATRQLIKALPGIRVYPRDNNIIPFTEQDVTYINFAPSFSVGQTVTVKLNGTSLGAMPIVDTAGLYAAHFAPPYGVFTVVSTFPDSSVITQYFQSVNLYTFLDSLAEESQSYRLRSIQTLANLSSQYTASGILRGMADEAAFNSFGDLAGFIRPFDWPFDRYADVVGGNSVTGVPGFMPVLTKGSTTGAVKDVVESVTGYTPSDTDFKTLQTVKWQLSRDGAKYDYLAGVHDTGAVGPHYFLKSDTGNTLSVPVATLESDIRKAFTILLNVEHDGFYVTDGEPLLRGTVDEIDHLGYTWLNPWAAAAGDGLLADAGFATYEHTITGAGDTTHALVAGIPSNGERVYLNGLYIDPTMYTYVTATGVLTLDFAPTLGDELLIDYITSGPVRNEEQFYADLTTYTVSLSHAAIANDMEVTINGGAPLVYGAGDDYELTALHWVGVHPLVPVSVGDTIVIKYNTTFPIVYGTQQYTETFTIALTELYLADPVIPASLEVYLNGQMLDKHSGQYTLTAPNRLTLNYTVVLGDYNQVVYYPVGPSTTVDDSELYYVATPPTFVSATAIIADSVKVFVEGIREPSSYYYIEADGRTLNIDYAGLAVADGQRVSVRYATEVTTGFNVSVVQGTTVYSQGYHFTVDYTYGHIIWNPLSAPVVDGSSYLVYYTYFPKNILDQLIGTIKPATMRVILQFTTATGNVFRPFFWGGAINVTGSVIY